MGGQGGVALECKAVKGGARLRSGRAGRRRAERSHKAQSHVAPGAVSGYRPRSARVTDRSCYSVCDWPRGRFGGSPERHNQGDDGDEDGSPGGAGAQRLSQAGVAVGQVADRAEEQDAGDDQEQDDDQVERGHGGALFRVLGGAPGERRGQQCGVAGGGSSSRENPSGAPVGPGAEGIRGRLTGTVNTVRRVGESTLRRRTPRHASPGHDGYGEGRIQ